MRSRYTPNEFKSIDEREFKIVMLTETVGTNQFLLLSFLIPALNEDKNIEGCISSVNNFMPVKYNYEIVVADHGSVDSTAELARSSGAVVFTKSGGTIAELRNYLVGQSSGDLLIFMDADIRLTLEWKNNIAKIVDSAISENMFISGSSCMPTNSDIYLNKYWFHPLAKKEKNYIGSGHMIITKKAFEKIGGFNKMLSSGEDYDLCMRAKRLNIPVNPSSDLKVVHLDYPEKMLDFIKREIWHGSGDFKSFGSFLNSKVAIAASIYFFVLVGLLIGVLLRNPIVGSAFLLVTFLLPTLVSYMNLPHLPMKNRIVNIYVCAIYLVARALSFAVRGKKGRFYSSK